MTWSFEFIFYSTVQYRDWNQLNNCWSVIGFGILCWCPLKSGLFMHVVAQKMKFSIKDFFSKCDQIRKKLRIWSHLLKKSIMENFLFCAVVAAREGSIWDYYFWLGVTSFASQSVISKKIPWSSMSLERTNRHH